MGVPDAEAQAQFRAFVLTHGDQLLRIALLITADPGHAEDLVQTALMRTYARWDRLHNEDPFRYARRIIINANVDRWRRHRGRELLTAEPPDTTSPDAGSRVVQRDTVLRALASLPVNERRVIVLRFLVDLSEAQTAAELGIPIGTIKSITHRAIRRLRASSHATDLNEVTP